MDSSRGPFLVCSVIMQGCWNGPNLHLSALESHSMFPSGEGGLRQQRADQRALTPLGKTPGPYGCPPIGSDGMNNRSSQTRHKPFQVASAC